MVLRYSHQLLNLSPILRLFLRLVLLRRLLVCLVFLLFLCIYQIHFHLVMIRLIVLCLFVLALFFLCFLLRFWLILLGSFIVLMSILIPLQLFRCLLLIIFFSYFPSYFIFFYTISYLTKKSNEIIEFLLKFNYFI